MFRTRRVPLLLVTRALALAALAAVAAGRVEGQQQDTTRAGARVTADSARRASPVPRRARTATADSANPRVTARDLVGADDPRCDDLCRRERMMDSLYGKDRERLVATGARTSPPKKP
jgi:hypothetical protein